MGLCERGIGRGRVGVYMNFRSGFEEEGRVKENATYVNVAVHLKERHQQFCWMWLQNKSVLTLKNK